jgi:hypothetical protein
MHVQGKNHVFQRSESLLEISLTRQLLQFDPNFASMDIHGVACTPSRKQTHPPPSFACVITGVWGASVALGY